MSKNISKHRVAFFTLNSPSLLRDITCSKLSRYGENIGDKKLPVEHTPEADPNVSPFQWVITAKKRYYLQNLENIPQH